jgi:DNA-binding response OmpR family regulator
VRNTYYIIVVEEDEVVFGRIVRALERLGRELFVRRVSTQEELDDELFRVAPDFVICDQARSEWNSFAVLEQVRAFQATMPFAALAADLGDEASTLLASGADCCVTHNRLGELVPTVQEMLRRRNERQSLCVEEIRRSFRRDEPPADGKLLRWNVAAGPAE